MTALTVTEYVMPEADAERLTQRIGLLLDAASGALDRLADAIREARDGRADRALGFESWAEYASSRFAPHTAGLTASIRRELVASLSVEADGSPALSTRQIAPAVGVTHPTVIADQRSSRQVVSDLPPEPTPPFDPITGEVMDAEPIPAKVMGLDGKTYSRPAPLALRAAPRRALTDVARDAGLDLRKVAERLARIREDDRFTANKNEVAAQLRHHLAYAIEVCQDLDNSINN